MPLILIAILLAISSQNKKTVTQTSPPAQKAQTSPAAQNITAQNADEILQQTDADINNNLNQVNNDLNNLDQIDTSNDNTANLNNL